jgi:predicted F0F1-ATPase subunit
VVERDPPFVRGDARERTRRDIDRFRRRERGSGFWHSLALVGSVGWPIVLLATGGALLGRYCDERFATGVRFTLMLLTMGAALGSFIAYRSLRGDES